MGVRRGARSGAASHTAGVASRMDLGIAMGENHAMGKTVLIVDDHPSFRASARRMLEADDYEVVGEAADGATAIEAVDRLQPEIVLLDIRLPDLDGFRVAEQLAANGKAPTVVLTSSRDRSDFDYEIAAGPAQGFIPKSELSAEAITLLVG
jgi:DNA-binding NarL/FixJ family response regulator